jgi:hypothetical protein
MMRILLVIGVIALTASCAKKDTGNGVSKTGRTATSAGPQTDAFDSSFFIGYVDYFPETEEFYTALFYREGHEYPDEDLLESKLDSVIVLNDDWGRERLPIEEAKRILVLSGLDSVSIYNRRNQLICKTSLTRVEYLWNGLESYFIAVFKSDGKFYEQTEELYGISSNYSSLFQPDFRSEEIEDGKLNEYLLRKLNISRAVEWDMRHYELTPPQTLYSIISSSSIETNEARSYLTSVENNEIKMLNEEIDNFNFLNILPVPIQMNGKPLLLISAGYPSSDVIWDYLAAFDGSRYEALDCNRVQIKDISRP